MDCGGATRCNQREQLALDGEKRDPVVERQVEIATSRLRDIAWRPEGRDLVNLHSCDPHTNLSSPCQVTVNEVSKLSGEATANNRKGKLIFFYEWDIQLKWTGRVNEGQKTASAGQLKIPNLSEENDLDEVQVEVSVQETDEQSMVLKQFMYNVGRDRIRKQLGVYLTELKEEFSKGLILPKKDGAPAATDGKNTAAGMNSLTSKFNNKINLEALNNSGASVQAKPPVGCKLDVANVEMVVEFNCQARELYDALTRPEMVTAFSRSLAQVDPIKGGE